MVMRLAGSLEIALLMIAAASTAHGKECSRLVTAQMRENALENVKKYDWAKQAQKSAIAGAERWAKMSDDELWGLITSQELPRDIHTNNIVGCPNCKDKIVPYGNYPWKCDFWGMPWKVKCPSCGEVYPKNDFYAFYKTALDEHGMFRHERGNRALLFNADHPDPSDPLHNVYVDDGYGMKDENGDEHHAVAYYVQWGHWRAIYNAVSSLAGAYTLTGDTMYAHKAGVLLDRIADVYPEMDFMPLHRMGFYHSHGGGGQGRIEGCIWETGVAKNLGQAYDYVYDAIKDDQELAGFCSQKAKRYDLGDKGTSAAICRHIEDHMLLEMLKSIKDGRISGNTGMTHTTLAAVAIALDRPEVTDEWLDWLFDPRFPGEHWSQKNGVPWVLVQGLDRDGMGGECGGYGLIWPHSFIALAELLAKYPPYTNNSMTKDYPKFKQCFLIEPRLNCLDAVLPAIGDSGATGTWGRAGNANNFVRGFKLYGDPQMAFWAWHYADGNVGRLRLPDDIFEEEPEALIQKTMSVAEDVGPLKLKCEHLGRYGEAVMQMETTENGRAMWVHYGYGKGHSHYDCLNLGLYARNIDMLPELGYPEYTGAWPKRFAWTSNTISHNTLLVGDDRSGYSPGGKVNLFAVQPPLRLFDVSSDTAYKSTRTYRRTAAMIDVSEVDSYVFDVFRARGGSNHRLSYHGPAETAAVEGIELEKQQGGTFAGGDVEFAELGGEKSAFYKSSGFTYLYDVERTAGPVEKYFTVDWKAEDKRGRIAEGKEPHLRLHSLTPCDEAALASGDPPQNKKGNPRRLRYLIQSRLGEDVESQFVTVLEPYEKTPFIKQVRKLRVEHQADPNSVAAVAVDLENGMTDILISCEEPAQISVEGGIEFDGQFGMIRLADGAVKSMRMSNARMLRHKGVELTCAIPAYKGKVTKVDASDPENHLVFLEPALPKDASLVGKVIHFKDKVPWDTSFDIKSVGDGFISTGDITIVAGFKNPRDFSSGYSYMVNEGDEYIVPNTVGLER